MKYSLVLLLLLILPLFPNVQTSNVCEYLTLTSNQKLTLNTNKILCGVSLKNNSVLEIENVNDLKVLGEIDLSDNSRLTMINSNITINYGIYVKNASVLEINNSSLTFPYDSFIFAKGNSKSLFIDSRLNSTNLEITIGESANSRIVRTDFYGSVYLIPSSNSNLIVDNSTGFILLIRDQEFNATISGSKLAISIEIPSLPIVNIGNIPRGFLSYWDPSIILDMQMTKVNVKIYNSYLNPPGLPPEIRITNKTNLRIAYLYQLKIAIMNVTEDIRGLHGGFQREAQFEVSGIRITLFQTEILEWALHYSTYNGRIFNSSYISIYASNNVNIEAININNINFIKAKNNAKISIIESVIVGKVFLQNNVQLIAKNTLIINLNDIITQDNAIAYIASINKANVFTLGTIATFEIEGIAAVISSTSEKLKMFELKISMVSKYPRTFTLLTGLENRKGLITSFSFSDIPAANYRLALEVRSTQNKVINTEKIVYVNTTLAPTKPPSPTIIVAINDSPMLLWSKNENLFIPTLGFNIYRGERPRELEKIAFVGANQTSFIDHNITRGKVYYYAVSAINEFGESNLSNVVSVTIPGNENRNQDFIIYRWIPTILLLTIILTIGSFIIRKRRKFKR